MLAELPSLPQSSEILPKRVPLPGPNGRLILRDMLIPGRVLHWFCNKVELPLLNKLGYGDVHCYNRPEIQALCDQSGLLLERFERRKGMRLHAVIRKQ